MRKFEILTPTVFKKKNKKKKKIVPGNRHTPDIVGIFGKYQNIATPTGGGEEGDKQDSFYIINNRLTE